MNFDNEFFNSFEEQYLLMVHWKNVFKAKFIVFVILN